MPLLLAALVPVFGLLSLFLGQTADWDLLNYHLYGPHAWLTGRWQFDIAPAQAQSFHNPLLHLPYYLGFVYLPHKLLAFLVGALQALLIIPLWFLGRKLLFPLSVPPLHIAALLVMGLMGPVFLSELGRDFGDNYLAIPILLALVLVIDKKSLSTIAVAGLISGAAVGLKLAFAFYLPALAAALLVMRWGHGIVIPMTILVVSAVTGLAATAGWWMWLMWLEYANPLFPYYNDWFQSPWAPLAANRDLRFVAGPLGSQLLKPLIAMFDYQQVLELKFRDFRPALLIITLLAWPWMSRAGGRLPALPRPLVAMLVFLLTAWLGWSVLFGYYRYTVVIEALLPIVLLALWLTLFRPGKVAANAMLGLLLLSQLLVKVPNWGRVDYGQLALDLGPLRDTDMLIGAGTAPAGWIALQLPDNVPYIRISGNLNRPGDGTGLSLAALGRIADHPGRLLVVTSDEEIIKVSAELALIGLDMDINSCQSITRLDLPSLGSGFWLCTLGLANQGITQTGFGR